MSFSIIIFPQGITVIGVCAVYEAFVAQDLRVDVLLSRIPSPFQQRRGGNISGDRNGHHQNSPSSSSSSTTGKRSPTPRPSSRGGGSRRRDHWSAGLDVGLVSRVAALAAAGVALLLLRFYVMGSTLPVFTSFDNPASYEGFPTKQVR